MTAPDGSSPAGSLAVGLFRAMQTKTVEEAKLAMSGGIRGSVGTAEGELDNSIKAPMEGQAGSIANHETRIVALEDGGTMAVYSGNDTWTNAGGRIGVGVINGGQAGQNGSGGTAERFGGNHGGYQYREFDAADLPATVAITVGAPGATQAQGGGTSSFGEFLVGISGTIGSILTSRGAVASASAPGAGGNNGGSYGSAGRPGGATALAAGGSGGNGGAGIISPGQPGGVGGSVPVDSLTPCGGSGGGGGGSNGGLAATAGNGGAGGAPGGGGGAGGNCDAGPVGAFGAGAAGRVFVIQSAGA